MDFTEFDRLHVKEPITAHVPSGPDAPKAIRRASLPADHREILNRTILGQDPPFIAASLGLSTTTVARIQASPLFQSERARMERTTEDRIQAIRDEMLDLAEIAKDRMRDLLESVDDGIRLRTCQDILDRAGFKAVEHRKTTVFNAAKMIENAWKLRQAKRDEVIDLDAVARD